MPVVWLVGGGGGGGGIAWKSDLPQHAFPFFSKQVLCLSPEVHAVVPAFENLCMSFHLHVVVQDSLHMGNFEGC